MKAKWSSWAKAFHDCSVGKFSYFLFFFPSSFPPPMAGIDLFWAQFAFLDYKYLMGRNIYFLCLHRCHFFFVDNKINSYSDPPPHHLQRIVFPVSVLMRSYHKAGIYGEKNRPPPSVEAQVHRSWSLTALVMISLCSAGNAATCTCLARTLWVSCLCFSLHTVRPAGGASRKIRTSCSQLSPRR